MRKMCLYGCIALYFYILLIYNEMKGKALNAMI